MGRISLRVGVVFLPFLASAAHGQSSALDLERMLNDSHQVVAAGAESQPLDGALQLAQADTGAPAASLPNGATSITEIFGDWTVNCAVRDNAKACATSQVQGDSQTGQQVFAIELYASASGGGDGVIVLPFGLDVQTPVTFLLDEAAWGTGATFSTCLPAGCIVPVAFPPAEFDALKRGTSLTVTAKSVSAGAETPMFTVSLAGFTAATNRVAQLSQ